MLPSSFPFAMVMASIIKRAEEKLPGPGPLDPAAITYITIAVIYTVLLAFGLVYIGIYRQQPAIQLRGAKRLIGTCIVIFLAVVAALAKYPTHNAFSCDIEFWYMSVVFPLSVALFQVSNVRLLAISLEHQRRRYANRWLVRKVPFGYYPARMLKWYQNLAYDQKTLVWVVAGYVLQIAMTFIMYFGSRRFHSATGIFGKISDEMSCRSGPEWIPAIAWQCLWSWLIGPMVLYRGRKIQDTHYWALQTRISVISGLLGAPMYIIFSFVRTDPVLHLNTYFPPLMWFVPGLVFGQFAAVLAPLWEVWVHRERPNPALEEANAQARARAVHTLRKGLDIQYDWDHFLYNLEHNTDAIAKFAATRDFTSENIEFLKRVTAFKRYWYGVMVHAPATIGMSFGAAERRRMFEDAATIWFELICASTAAIEINVDQRIYRALQDVFKDVSHANIAERTGDSLVNPWDSDAPITVPERAHIGSTPPDAAGVAAGTARGGGAGLKGGNIEYGLRPTQALPRPPFPPLTTSHDMNIVYEDGSAPPSLLPSIFDAAETCIARMTFRHTWANFAKTPEAVRIPGSSPHLRPVAHRQRPHRLAHIAATLSGLGRPATARSNADSDSDAIPLVALDRTTLDLVASRAERPERAYALEGRTIVSDLPRDRL